MKAMNNKAVKIIKNFGKYNLPVHVFYDNTQAVYKAYIYYGKRLTTCISCGKTISDIEKDIERKNRQ